MDEQYYEGLVSDESREDEVDASYYQDDASWSGSDEELETVEKRYSGIRTIGLIFAVVISGLIIGAFVVVQNSSVQLEDSIATPLKALLGVAVLAVAVQFVYLTFVAVSSLQRTDEDLKSKNEVLEKANAELLETKSELGESNDSLQEALGVVQEMSEQNEQRAKRLESMTSDLDQSKKESDAIFDSVQHGLCLIDDSFNIGNRVSKTSYDIFETQNIANHNFVDLMRPLITEKDLKTVVDYLKLQFSGKASKKQLDRHNPLKKVEVTLSWDGGSFKNKHLGFEFERVKTGKKVGAVLVTITDISETVSLERQLKKNAESQDRKSKLIVEILQNEASEVDLFIAKATKTLDQINDSLKEQGVDSEGDTSETNRKVLEEVFSMVHNIKGNAGLLKLRTIAGLAHEVEDSLAELRERAEIKGEEFLSALVGLAELREVLSDCEDIVLTVLRDFNSRGGGSSQAAPAALTKSQKLGGDLVEFVDTVAADMGKEVILNSHMDVDKMDGEGMGLLTDVIIQTLRNSIVHGVEAPDMRAKRGKLKEGVINIVCKRRDEVHPAIGQPYYDVVVRDDGNGLDLAAIREKARANGIISDVQAESISNSEVAGLIFEPNLSTASETTQHGGRGSGMHIIKDKVINDLDGKISMRFSKGAYMEFSFLIPVNAVEPEAA